MLYTLYVGADNKTAKVDDIKLFACLLRYGYQAWTSTLCWGYWEGKPEMCCKVELVTESEDDNLEFVVRQLANELGQKSILLTKTFVSHQFVEGTITIEG
jgi:hypothetical protein